MPKIGRNDPCPCGSGQKYKRCCLPRDEAAAAVERAAAPPRAGAPAVPPFEVVAEDDGLDEASNVVIDLIDAGRLDDAELAAADLLTRYPEVHDGLERVAMVAAARGDRTRAAEYYRRAADFVHARPEYYDPEMESYLREGRRIRPARRVRRTACQATRGAEVSSIEMRAQGTPGSHQEVWRL